MKTANLAPLAAFAISPADIRLFNGVATIVDEPGFAAALTALIRKKIHLPQQSAADIERQIKEKADALTAKTRWQPSAADLQQGRAQMLEEFNTPNNLPLAQFAKLANKSRQQLYKDVAAKRLLALSVGKRGLRIPDWQLDPDQLELTRRLLTKAEGVDEWTLFHALSLPMDALQGKAAVEAVRKSNIDKVLSAVLNDLGFHD